MARQSNKVGRPPKAVSQKRQTFKAGNEEHEIIDEEDLANLDTSSGPYGEDFDLDMVPSKSGARAVAKASDNGGRALKSKGSGLSMKESYLLEKSKGRIHSIAIAAPKFEVATIRIEGISPLVQHKFSAKLQQQMEDKQRAGSTAGGKRNRQPKDFEQTYRDAMHISVDKWHGIPAPAFRSAMISACRLVGYKMTLAKLSIFVEADGFDGESATPLIRITKGKPQVLRSVVRNETGVPDIRWRPMWPQWEATVRVRYDADQFTFHDIYNLMMRVGQQVGIGEGRPDSKDSAGQGWGMFRVLQQQEITSMRGSKRLAGTQRQLRQEAAE